MNKRKRTVPAHDNPIIAALRRSFPGGFTSSLDVDRPPERVLDRVIAWGPFKDAIREIGALVVKALLTDDRQIVRIVKNALRESNHFFSRDRELVLRKEVAKYLPDLRRRGLDIKAERSRNVPTAVTNCTRISGTGCARRFLWLSYPLDGLESQARKGNNCVSILVISCRR
jgi:hypothetical protein